MMRLVLFDLGNTLLDDADRPLPGAVDMLTALHQMHDPEGQPIFLALLSDFTPAARPDQLEPLRQEYYQILRDTGLDRFFEPLRQRVTLSTEVGVTKPAPLLFRTAIDRVAPGAPFHHVLFVTENPDHIRAARELGMMAVHFQGPGQSTGEIVNLSDLVPLVERLLMFSPCGKRPSEAVGRYASPANRSKRLDPAVQALTSQVSAMRLRERMAALTALGTRWSHSPAIGRVPEWIHAQLLALGYSAAETRYQAFELPGSQQQRNVLCGPSADHPGFVLLCAHYDSLSETPAALAPGADDNASGMAVLLEVAAILRTVTLRRGVLFAAFGGEEQGLFGSAFCADIAARENWHIDVVVNLDMIAYQDPSRAGHIIVEYDQGNRHPGNDAAARAYSMLMAQAAADYTSLTVEHTDIWNSDYIPFEAKGYPCIGVYEASQNPAYHRTTDILEQIDMAHLSEVAKMVVATLYLLAR